MIARAGRGASKSLSQFAPFCLFTIFVNVLCTVVTSAQVQLPHPFQLVAPRSHFGPDGTHLQVVDPDASGARLRWRDSSATTNEKGA